ncbi:WD40/YVTN/BNR-like repeat-containing protein [Burkholderia ubonensis]|uniref:WD40/YVTN/BNR-like repeat-containing protein n=1 Tax=Burkholderia ubonensis TaxID=101571 RepID=UPI0009B42A90|nr:PKD domain-containing protein [Burkholderia ubonensis]
MGVSMWRQPAILRSATWSRTVQLLVITMLAACGDHHVSRDGAGIAPVPDLPTAQIVSVDPHEPTVAIPVSFHGVGTGVGIRYGWQFGDGATGAGPQVTHTYASAGTFEVTLTVVDVQGAVATSTTTVTVSALESPPSPPSIVTLSGASPVPGSALSFLAVSTSGKGGPLTYAWSFGDGQAQTGSHAQHAYGAVGRYVVSVTATDPAGLSATSTTTVTIVPAPVNPPAPPLAPTIVAPDEIRAQSAIAFLGDAQPPPNGSVTSYTWDFGDGSSGATGNNVVHTYAVAGPRVVTLTVTDSIGRTETATANIEVLPLQPPQGVVIHGPLEVPLGESADFMASFENPGGGAVTYAWDFGDGATSGDASPSHTYAAAGQYTVRLTVSNSVSVSSSASMTLEVVDKDEMVDLPCAGNSAGTGWCIAPGLPIGPTSLNAISFGDARSGWIGGESGALIHSTDGGLTWTIQIASGNAIRSISAVDDNHVWALDSQRNVLSSSDAGATWQPMATGSSSTLVAIKFADQRHGWAVGPSENIWATADGGQSWALQHSNTSNPALNAIDATDVNDAFAVSDNGSILRTNNGGQSWDLAFRASGTALKGISFGGVSTGFAVGRGAIQIYKTTDSGSTWTAVTSPTSEALLAVKFVTPSIGWVVSESGRIFRTDDSGGSWRLQNLPSQTLGLPALDAANATNAWLVTAGGAYFITGTGGVGQ